MIFAIDRTKWLQTRFSKTKPGNWQCPICKRGVLQLGRDEVLAEPSGACATSKREYYQNNPYDRTERFATVLVCNNASCKEPVSMCGESRISYIEDGTFPKKVERVYAPRFFHPTLEVFSIPTSCPKEVAEQTLIAFSHYFNDLKASANAIRTSLELIMDAQKV